MKEYIEREAAIEILNIAYPLGMDERAYDTMHSMISKRPAADVMEVGKLTEAGRRLLKYCPEVINQVAAQICDSLGRLILDGNSAVMRAPCDEKERKEP